MNMPRKTKITYAYHDYVHAWKTLKEAKRNYDLGLILREELFDHQMFEHEMECEFIDVLKSK